MNFINYIVLFGILKLISFESEFSFRNNNLWLNEKGEAIVINKEESILRIRNKNKYQLDIHDIVYSNDTIKSLHPFQLEEKYGDPFELYYYEFLIIETNADSISILPYSYISKLFFETDEPIVLYKSIAKCGIDEFKFEEYNFSNPIRSLSVNKSGKLKLVRKTSEKQSVRELMNTDSIKLGVFHYQLSKNELQSLKQSFLDAGLFQNEQFHFKLQCDHCFDSTVTLKYNDTIDTFDYNFIPITLYEVNKHLKAYLKEENLIKIK